MNLQTYVETEFASFDEKPFNELDAAVFTQLAMVRVELPFLAQTACTLDDNGMLVSPSGNELPPVFLRDLLCAEFMDQMFTGLAASHVQECLLAVAMNPRYRTVRITGYQTVLDPVKEVQFSATTFSCPQFTFIGLRGTDASLTGWQEDFNLSFMNPIPGQVLAVEYIQAYLAQNGDRKGPIYLGGHSKGGNLAEYVLLTVPQLGGYFDRFFSFDGPGFKKDAFTAEQFAALEPYFLKLVPQDSIIGMILDSDAPFQVVESTELGFMQHDLFSWEIEGDAFVRRSELTQASQTIDAAMREWIHSYSDQELASFVEALFHAAYSSGAFDLKTLFGGGMQSVAYLRAAAASVDDHSALVLKRFSSDLAEALGVTMASQASEALNEALETVRDQVREQALDQVFDQVRDQVEGKLRAAHEKIAAKARWADPDDTQEKCD